MTSQHRQSGHHHAAPADPRVIIRAVAIAAFTGALGAVAIAAPSGVSHRLLQQAAAPTAVIESGATAQSAARLVSMMAAHDASSELPGSVPPTAVSAALTRSISMQVAAAPDLSDVAVGRFTCRATSVRPAELECATDATDVNGNSQSAVLHLRRAHGTWYAPTSG
jgi:hypothetical protein